jgi:outer membrane protein OmpA-like peptidoglycan-associated protein
MNKILIIIILFISSDIYAQQVFFGIPNEYNRVKPGDIIIINEIHWINNNTNFSEIGRQQIEELKIFLSKFNAFRVEILVHSFFSNNIAYNQDVSNRIVEKLQTILIENNSSIKQHLSIKGYGSTIILVSKENIEKKYYNKVNNRIEIKIEEM